MRLFVSLFFAAALLFSGAASGASQAVVGTQLYTANKTTTGASSAFKPKSEKRTYQVIGATTSGAGSATVDIQVSNDCTNYMVLATVTLTLSTSVATDGQASDAPWRCTRANVTAISGTGAYVQVYMAEEG